jgi:hypothetical protein
MMKNLYESDSLRLDKSKPDLSEAECLGSKSGVDLALSYSPAYSVLSKAVGVSSVIFLCLMQCM